ncbi:MAG: hypothetical protein ABIH76_02085, partial [Candidatus Bathyarchaeota archaeon]
QIRYKDYSHLEISLKQLLNKLQEISKNKREYIVNLKPIIEKQIEILTIFYYTKALVIKNFSSRILDLKRIGSTMIAVVDKGEPDGIRKGMIFEVYELIKAKVQPIEKNIGGLIITHPQDKISQAQPNPRNMFESYAPGPPPNNIVKPFLPEEYRRRSKNEIEEHIDILKTIRKYYY